MFACPWFAGWPSSVSLPFFTFLSRRVSAPFGCLLCCACAGYSHIFSSNPALFLEYPCWTLCPHFPLIQAPPVQPAIKRFTTPPPQNSSAAIPFQFGLPTLKPGFLVLSSSTFIYRPPLIKQDCPSLPPLCVFTAVASFFTGIRSCFSFEIGH